MDTNKQEWKEKVGNFLFMNHCHFDESTEICYEEKTVNELIKMYESEIVSPLESSIKEKDKEIERLEGKIHDWLGRLDLLDWNNYLERVIDEMREALHL